ncbi:hypothetical protein ACFVZW_06560 [Streptomyces sp. NPDC059567]|uniref:hypothetical protein n=1 Tax=Streptomyces sp. NPDC059567 TaxID=3346867 RepID=UPI0036CAB8B7
MAEVRHDWPDSRMLLVSMLVLFQEAVLATIVVVLYGQTQESPNAVGNQGLGLVLVLPVLLVVGSAVLGAVALFLVLPAVSLSHQLGRRFGGRETWWWALPVAAVFAFFLLAAAVQADVMGPLTALKAWLPVAVVLVVPTLLARLQRQGLLRSVALWGSGVVVAVGVFGGIAVSTGLIEEYRPPQLTRAVLDGTWSDGRGGTLTFTTVGKVTASGIDHRLGSGDLDEAVECTGQGTWTLQTIEDTGIQEVDLTIPGCSYAPWNVGGTPARITLYQYIGDPDSWNLYEVNKTPTSP